MMKSIIITILFAVVIQVQGACEDIDNGAEDLYGQTCADYTNSAGMCNMYDDDDFSAGMMCCACFGGMDFDAPASSKVCSYVANNDCLDEWFCSGADEAIYAVETKPNVYDYDCTYIPECPMNPTELNEGMICEADAVHAMGVQGNKVHETGAVLDFTTPEGTSSDLNNCGTSDVYEVVCTGGELEEEDLCSAADNCAGCGEFNYSADTWWTLLPEHGEVCALTGSGICDYSGWTCRAAASTGGAETTSAEATEDPTSACVDLDNGAQDDFGDGCQEYVGNLNWCGMYDDDDFDSNVMCCTCGGGSMSGEAAMGDSCDGLGQSDCESLSYCQVKVKGSGVYKKCKSARCSSLDESLCTSSPHCYTIYKNNGSYKRCKKN